MTLKIQNKSVGLSRVSSPAQIKICGLLETIVWRHFDLKMSFNTRYKTLPYIISSKLNFGETYISNDYTKLMIVFGWPPSVRAI